VFGKPARYRLDRIHNALEAWARRIGFGRSRPLRGETRPVLDIHPELVIRVPNGGKVTIALQGFALLKVQREIQKRIDAAINLVEGKPDTEVRVTNHGLFVRVGDGAWWDEAQADRNFRQYGVSFEAALQAFDDVYAVVPRSTHNIEKPRVLLGMSQNSLLTVTYTVSPDGRISIISASRAGSTERLLYDRSP
jgi:uncharacterized DUF497 family protein